MQSSPPGSATPRRAVSRGTRAPYWGWRIATALLTRAPARALPALAYVAGSATYYCWPRGRRAMHRNFSRVMPAAARADVRRTARRSMINYCGYLAEFLRLPAVSPSRAADLVGGEAEFARLAQVAGEGRGAIIVCMHFGNWDAGAAAAAARGFPVNVVADEFADPGLDAMVLGARQRLGMGILKANRVRASVLRVLKRGEILALLIDQPAPADGVEVEFFGRPVRVPQGPARIALRAGVPVVAAGFPKCPGSGGQRRVVADFGIPIPAGRDEAAVRKLTQSIMSAYERFIREDPEEWYMFRELWPRRST